MQSANVNGEDLHDTIKIEGAEESGQVERLDSQNVTTEKGRAVESEQKEKGICQDNPMRILKFAYFCIFADFLGLTVCLPLLPFYAIKLGATPVLVGAVLGLFSVGQMLGNVVLGRLSDQVGRRPVVIASLFGSCMAYILHGLANDLKVLLIIRFFSGVVCGTMPVCQAMILDTIPNPIERGKYMGYCGGAMGFAFILGPGMGAAASVAFGLSGAFFCAALPPFIFGAFAAAKLEETKPPKKNKGPHVEGRPWPKIGNLILVAMFLNAWSFACMNSMTCLLWKDFWGWGSAELGVSMTVAGCLKTFMEMKVVGKSIKKVGALQVNFVGSLLLGLGMIGHAHVELVWAHLAIFGVVMASWAVIMPSSATAMGDIAQKSARGLAMGANASSMSLGRTIAPFVSGFLYEQKLLLRHETLPLSTAPFILAGLLDFVSCLCMGMLYLRTAQGRKTGEGENQT